MRAPVLCVPLVALMPLQFPEALHDVASVELQFRVEAAPLITAVFAALRDAVGGGRLVGGATVVFPHATKIRNTLSGTKRIQNLRPTR